jgi:hypothetical protein
MSTTHKIIFTIVILFFACILIALFEGGYLIHSFLTAFFKSLEKFS